VKTSPPAPSLLSRIRRPDETIGKRSNVASLLCFLESRGANSRGRMREAIGLGARGRGIEALLN
jgi:hypothetical protein